METGLGSRASMRHPFVDFHQSETEAHLGAFESRPDLFSRRKAPPAHPREFWDLRFTHVCLVHRVNPHTAEP